MTQPVVKRISKSTVDAAVARDGEFYVWDDALTGFEHSHIELHFDPVSLWVRLRSPIRFIRFAVTDLLF